MMEILKIFVCICICWFRNYIMFFLFDISCDEYIFINKIYNMRNKYLVKKIFGRV